MKEQKEFSGVVGDDFYIQVRLDGTVRTSGIGSPPWKQFVSDIPTLDSVATKYGENIGPSI